MPASPAQALRGRVRRLVAGCCAPAAAALALTPAALAADREITVGPGTPQQWQGRAALAPSLLEPATLLACNGSPADVCDTTLLHVEGEGTLSVALAERDEGTPDVDLYVYRSDPFGLVGPLRAARAAREGGPPDVALSVYRSVPFGPAGPLPAVPAGPDAAEAVDIPAASGSYLVRAASFALGRSGFTGSATLTPRSPVPD